MPPKFCQPENIDNCHRKKINSFLKKFITQSGDEFLFVNIVKKSTPFQKENMDLCNAKLYYVTDNNLCLDEFDFFPPHPHYLYILTERSGLKRR
jgi:hypothetical protein